MEYGSARNNIDLKIFSCLAVAATRKLKNQYLRILLRECASETYVNIAASLVGAVVC